MEITTRMVDVKGEGGTMPVYECRPKGAGPFPAVIVVMEAFGLNTHIKDVAGRVAQEGYVTAAPDLYYREKERVFPYTNLDAAIKAMNKLVDDKVMQDIGAVIGYLKKQGGVRAERMGTVGFCMGGRVTFLTACKHPQDVKAAVSFYGGGIAAGGPTPPLSFAERISCPILCLFGDQDPLIPRDQVTKIDETLKRLGKRYEVKVYAGATHGFFCNERPSYNTEAAADAWKKTGEWFAKHLKA